MKKFISTTIVLALLISIFAIPTTAFARQSNYFASYGTVLSAPGNGVVHLSFSVTGVGICSTLGVANYQVQRKDGNNWIEVTGPIDGGTGSNIIDYSMGKYYQGTAGQIYRVVCTFICVNDYGAGTKSYTSPQITAK